jgi:hypothetical protein
LGVAVRITLGAAVADRDVEEAVGPELQLAAIVEDGLEVRNLEHDSPAGRIGDVGVVGRTAELLNTQVMLLGRDR